MPDLTGQNIGRYLILEQLGEGGMATVYKAFDTRLERDVAVKVIRVEQFAPVVLKRILKRFDSEAKVVASLTHTNIVGVIDFGEHEGSPYMVMPYLPGGTLKQRLGQPVPWQEAVKLVLPIAEALDYAHSQNIIHRDVKPSNILLTQSGQPMLTDFGIAKILESEAVNTMTGTGVGVGTPEYMAPEQWIGQAGTQADIYSLGVVLYELVTGRKPYIADTPPAIMLKQANDPLPRPRQTVPGLPQAVEKVIFKALAKKPEDRYQSMGEFAKALEGLAAGQAIAAKRTVEERRQEEEGTRDILIPLAESRRRSLKPTSWVAIGGLMVLVVLVAGLGIGLRSLGQKGLGPLAGLATRTSTPTFTSTFTPTYTYSPTLPPTITRSPTPSMTLTPTLPSNASIGSAWNRPADNMVMVFVPQGDFKMGSPAGIGENDEHPQHSVYVDDFWIDKTEITNSMYALCVNVGACLPLSSFSSYTRKSYYDNSTYANYPVIQVSWEDASAYCSWAGSRLPTEAEWEKAARGTEGRTYPWGNTWDVATILRLNFSDKNANFVTWEEWDNSVDDGFADTSPVGYYPLGASPFGALDMAGNVWEWIADWYDENYYAVSPKDNPTGPASGEFRVIRGGSWDNHSYEFRTANRWNNPAWYVNIGFRCVRSGN